MIVNLKCNIIPFRRVLLRLIEKVQIMYAFVGCVRFIIVINMQ